MRRCEISANPSHMQLIALTNLQSISRPFDEVEHMLEFLSGCKIQLVFNRNNSPLTTFSISPMSFFLFKLHVLKTNCFFFGRHKVRAVCLENSLMAFV